MVLTKKAQAERLAERNERGLRKYCPEGHTIVWLDFEVQKRPEFSYSTSREPRGRCFGSHGYGREDGIWWAVTNVYSRGKSPVGRLTQGRNPFAQGTLRYAEDLKPGFPDDERRVERSLIIACSLHGRHSLSGNEEWKKRKGEEYTKSLEETLLEHYNSVSDIVSALSELGWAFVLDYKPADPAKTERYYDPDYSKLYVRCPDCISAVEKFEADKAAVLAAEKADAEVQPA